LKKSVFDETLPVDAAEIVGLEHATVALLKGLQYIEGFS
jgi:hypothetical protein